MTNTSHDTTIAVHIGTLQDMGKRFVDAWQKVVTGEDIQRDHITFLALEQFMVAMSSKRLELMRHLRRTGPRSVRMLSQELRRDYKSVHSEVARLIDAGLIERTETGKVAVGWDRIVTELDLAA